MAVVINAIKNGSNLWKQAWFTEIIALIVLSVASMLVIMQTAILIAIPTLPWINTNWVSYTNPIFWLIFLVVGALFATIISVFVGTVQRIAHDYAETRTGRFEDAIIALIPKIFPLAMLGIFMMFVIAIPALFINNILNPLVFVVLNPSNNNILQNLIFTILIIVVSGPWSLAISKIVIDEEGSEGIIEGWKLYFHKFIPTIIISALLVIILYVFLSIFIGLGFFLGVFSLDSGTIASLPIILLFIGVGMVLGTGMFFILFPWMFTVMYTYYQEIKE